MKKDKLRKYERPIGAFCGAVIGLFAVGILAALFSDMHGPSTAVGVVTGAIGGTFAGWRFPSVSHGAYWLLDLIWIF